MLVGIGEAILNRRVPSSPAEAAPAPSLEQLFVWLHAESGGELICLKGAQFEEIVFSAGSVPLSDSPCGCTPRCAGHRAVCKWKRAARCRACLGTENWSGHSILDK